MPVRKGKAQWSGSLFEGEGTISIGNGQFEKPYSAGSRFSEERGTNPEELIAAAHAGCFSMALSEQIANTGYEVKSISTEANVKIQKIDRGFKITHITLNTTASAPGLTESEFLDLAEKAKKGCPVSQALNVPISLSATLSS